MKTRHLIIAALILLLITPLWMVWMTAGLPLRDAFDPSTLWHIIVYAWPIIIASALFTAELVLPFQLRFAQRHIQTRLNYDSWVSGRSSGYEDAERDLSTRETALQTATSQIAQRKQALKDREAQIEQRVRDGVAAARQAQHTAEAERDEARAEGRKYRDQAADAEHRRQNAAGAAERRRRKLSRTAEA